MVQIPVLSLVLICIIFISSQSSSAFAENSTSTISNYTEPEPINTIQTDKSTYNYNEIIHVTGESSLVNRVQITHSNGDNMINAWLGAPIDNFYEYDIDLISLYNGNNLRESGNYIINAIQDNTVLKSKTVYINVAESIPEPVMENYTASISNYTESVATADSSSIASSSSGACGYCYRDTGPVTESNEDPVTSSSDEQQVITVPSQGITDDPKPVTTSDEQQVITVPSQVITDDPKPELEQSQLPKQDNQTEQTIVLWSNKSFYEDGDNIRIEGKISEESSVINVKVYNPSNFNIVDESYKVSKNGIFELNFDTSNYLWYENGTYVIQVEDRNNEINKIKVIVTEASLEPVLLQNNTISQINSTSHGDDGREQLLEENGILREELELQREQIDALTEQVGYLVEILKNIQGFFGSVFT